MIGAFATQSHPASIMLQINLFGVPAIARCNTPQQVQRRQTRALLWRLAADLQPVTKSQLRYLCWPDGAETTARRNFARLVVLLRRAGGTAASECCSRALRTMPASLLRATGEPGPERSAV